MKKSDFTKKMQSKLWTLRIIDFILLVAPLAVYIIWGLVDNNTILVKKVTLIGSVTIALMLTLFNIIAKKHMRSAIWIAVIGIYIAVNNIAPLLYCIAGASVVDEFILTPMINRIHTEYLSSFTLDKRQKYEAKVK